MNDKSVVTLGLRLIYFGDDRLIFRCKNFDSPRLKSCSTQTTGAAT